MTRTTLIPPAETDLLCEFCGYTLNGLPADGNCPECGRPIAASLNSKRRPPQWEQKPRVHGIVVFVTETARIIFHPTHFFQNVTTRGDVPRAARFGHTHWVLASILFGVAAGVHAGFFSSMNTIIANDTFTGWVGMVVFAIMSYLALWITTRIAVRLTAWEAAYRGYRLPLNVVMRGMYYHAAHYLPVGIIAAATVIVAHYLIDPRTVTESILKRYLYVISGEIILAAVYLFQTYWIAMRNMMYANR